MAEQERISDDEFKSFVQSTSNQSKPIESIEEFQDWKDDFLKTFRQYLNPDGTATAREVDEELYQQLDQLANALQTTQKFIDEGKISPDSSTVSGQRTINEMVTLIKNCETAVEDYVPKTKAQEKKCGYTKFELAAVLVRDGFSVYGLMVKTRDELAALVTEGGALSEILRPNQLTIIMYYFRALEAFAEFMADLGMYQIMEQCVEVYKIRPRSKNKKNRYRRGKGKDALDDTTDEESERKKKPKKKKAPKKEKPKPKPKPPPEPEPEPDPGPMFENKHKDTSVKVRAIMDNGWSNGFMPGQEIKDPNMNSPNNYYKKKAGKSNKLSSTKKGNGSRDSSSNGTGKKGNEPHGDSKDPSKLDNTDTTDDDIDDDGSSSHQDDDDDDDEEDEYIYYFDPNQGIVGKIPRTKCLEQKLIVSASRKTGKETFDGVVDHWDSKQEGGTTIPGKMDLIDALKDILRGKARPEVA